MAARVATAEDGGGATGGGVANGTTCVARAPDVASGGRAGVGPAATGPGVASGGAPAIGREAGRRSCSVAPNATRIAATPANAALGNARADRRGATLARGCPPSSKGPTGADGGIGAVGAPHAGAAGVGGGGPDGGSVDGVCTGAFGGSIDGAGGGAIDGAVSGPGDGASGGEAGEAGGDAVPAYSSSGEMASDGRITAGGIRKCDWGPPAAKRW